MTKLGAIGGIAIVDKPVQKYSVMFLRDEKDGTLDQYNYCLVEYAINARAPFDGWEVEQTTRREPHEHFADLGKNDPCPCNSGNNYEDCCLHESGVLWPHWEFTFSIEPRPRAFSKTSSSGARGSRLLPARTWRLAPAL